MTLKSVAQNKICPFITYPANESQCFDANFPVTLPAFCYTDNCMAWETLHPEQREEHGHCKLIDGGKLK